MRLVFSAFVCLATALLFVSSAQAQKNLLTVDLSQDHVDITTGFTGADIVVFGMKEALGQIAVVVRGPEHDMIVRQKARSMGVWYNSKWMRFKDVPSYYDYAVSVPEKELGPAKVLKANGIGMPAMRFKPSSRGADVSKTEKFQKALIRNKQAEELFPVKAGEIEFLADDFFKTKIHVPSNVPIGNYQIQTFLLNNGEVISDNIVNLKVSQVGMSAGIHMFANKHSLTYGLLCVLIAVISGWMANMMRRRDV